MSSDRSSKPAKQLDLRGLKCPLPVLRTRKALHALACGETLEVFCTDPLAAIDVPALLQQTGDHLQSVERDENQIVFVVVKAATQRA